MIRLHKILTRFCLAIVILTAVNLALFSFLLFNDGFRNIIPLPAYLSIYRAALRVSAVLCWISIPAVVVLALLFSKRYSIFQYRFLIIGFLILSPFCCLLTYMTLSLPETIFNKAELDGQHYYLTVQSAIFDPWTFYYVYRCNGQDMNCKKIHNEVSGSSVDPTQLVVDEHTHEINIFRRNIASPGLDYTYGPQTHEYKYVDVVVGKNEVLFQLYSYKNDSALELLITRCDDRDHATVSCEILPVRYSPQAFSKAEISYDETSQVLSLQIDGRLILSYDTAPHCYVDVCRILEK